MVYAPQTMADVKVVVDIVRAAAWWVGGLALGEGGERGKGVVVRDGDEGLL